MTKFKTISKLSAALNPVYKHSHTARQLRMVTILSPRMAYLATGRTKEDDNDFSTLVDDNSQADKQRKHTSAFLLIALGAEDDSTPQIR